MSNVALIILFNHNYENNLDILDDIYSSRFGNIWYVIPFYNGNRENVISVYENSLYFQGYIVAALTQLQKNKYDHYLIIGDDLFLKPEINEKNYKYHFNLDEDSGFIPGPFLLNNLNEIRPSRPYAPYWGKEHYAINFNLKQPGIEALKFLPSYNEAKELLKLHGFNFTNDLSYKKLLLLPIFKRFDKKNNLKNKYQRFRILMNNIKFIFSNQEIKYPFVGSYSDICIIPHKSIDKFKLYAGIFTAYNLFVEIALPTALLFSSEKIITEDNLELKGKTYWFKDEILENEKKFKLSLSNLKNNFPDKTLYIHPIKLSKWER